MMKLNEKRTGRHHVSPVCFPHDRWRVTARRRGDRSGTHAARHAEVLLHAAALLTSRAMLALHTNYCTFVQPSCL